MKGRNLERIRGGDLVAEFADALPAYFQKHLDWTPAEERRSALEAFIQTHQTWNQAGKRNKSFNFSEDSIFQLLRKLKITGRQFFEILGAETPPIPPEYLKIIEICERMDEQRAKSVLEIAEELSTRWRREAGDALIGPSKRINVCFSRLYSKSRGGYDYFDAVVDQRQQELLLSDAVCQYVKDEYICLPNRVLNIPYRVLPAMMAFVGIGPHWGMCLPDDLSYHDCTPICDLIIDAFSFMPQSSREIFLSFLEVLSNAESIEL